MPAVDFLGTSIVFNDVSRFRQLQEELETTNRQLETAYEELQSTNEELETTNEELQSTVEELETTNEELQSTNEELETMNEELQSMNDELQATNEELRERTTEITELNLFMESILSSLGAAVVVVDRDLMVQVWNRQAEELWGLREDETVGEHFLNLDIGLPTEQLKPLIRGVIFDKNTEMELLLEAVNRRGRNVTLRVTATPLVVEPNDPTGALLLMEHSGSVSSSAVGGRDAAAGASDRFTCLSEATVVSSMGVACRPGANSDEGLGGSEGVLPRPLPVPAREREEPHDLREVSTRSGCRR